MIRGAANYGLFLAFVMFVLTRALPEPLGWVFFWSALVVQLASGAAIVWRRTSLAAMTGALAWGGANAAFFATMSWRGIQFDDLLVRHPVLVIASLLIAPFCIYLERWLQPTAWQHLERAQRGCSLRNVLAFRHIPDLRPTSHKAD